MERLQLEINKVPIRERVLLTLYERKREYREGYFQAVKDIVQMLRSLQTIDKSEVIETIISQIEKMRKVNG